MDIKQEFREAKNMDVYAMNVNDGSFSNVYVKWLEAKINHTRCCTELKDEPKLNFGNWKFSQQREQLIDFCAKLELKAKQYSYLIPDEDFIDEYLKDN